MAKIVTTIENQLTREQQGLECNKILHVIDQAGGAEKKNCIVSERVTMIRIVLVARIHGGKLSIQGSRPVRARVGWRFCCFGSANGGSRVRYLGMLGSIQADR